MKPLIDSLQSRYPPYGLWRWLIAGVLALVMAAWLARDGVTLTAFPATEVLDSFDRANGGLGASWSGSSGGYSVAGNLLSVGSGGDVYWRGTAFGGARGRTDVPKIVDWYMNGKIEIDPMITHILPLEKINSAFDLMHEGKSIRSVVMF